MLIAVILIVGSILLSFGLRLIIKLIAAWELKRNYEAELEDLATTLGITVEHLSDERLTSRIVELTSERFSDELLSNRLSDFCELVRTVWDWLGVLIQILTFLFVTFMTIDNHTDRHGSIYFEDGAFDFAINAWWIVAIGLFFWIAGVLFALGCRLFTGRYPGQAKQARKAVTDFLTSRWKQMSPSEENA
jgi:hypothetical protein